MENEEFISWYFSQNRIRIQSLESYKRSTVSCPLSKQTQIEQNSYENKVVSSLRPV
jgi:hypothetical protein